MKDRDEEKVSADVGRAGYDHSDERRPCVADPSEYGGKQVICDDHHRPCAAEEYVVLRLGESFRRSLHDGRQLFRGQSQNNGEGDADKEEKPDRAADDPAAHIFSAFSQLLSHEDSNAHGKADDDAGDSEHELGACGDCRNVGRFCEPAYYEKVHRTVQRLQKHGKKHRQREAEKWSQYFSLCEISSFRHFPVILQSFKKSRTDAGVPASHLIQLTISSE